MSFPLGQNPGIEDNAAKCLIWKYQCSRRRLWIRKRLELEQRTGLRWAAASIQGRCRLASAFEGAKNPTDL